MIITLCGSARFEKLFHVWNEVLTLSGHTVFSLAVYPSQKRGKKDWYTDEEKTLLDKAHLNKIRKSDAIFVLNRFAYIGPSTLNEISFARKKGKKLFALESWGQGGGIGQNHTAFYIAEAKKLKIFGTYSPIDTFSPYFFDPWDLLPEAGAFRSSLVNRAEDARYCTL